MRLAILLTIVLGLVACGGGERPEPEIRTVEVRVPIAQSCGAAEQMGPAPSYADTNEAIRSAPNLFEQVRLLLAGREIRIARLDALENAIEACR